MPDERKTDAGEASPRPDRQTPPPAGPHAAPERTNPEATPGAGALPDPEGGADAAGGSG